MKLLRGSWRQFLLLRRNLEAFTPHKHCHEGDGTHPALEVSGVVTVFARPPVCCLRRTRADDRGSKMSQISVTHPRWHGEPALPRSSPKWLQVLRADLEIQSILNLYLSLGLLDLDILRKKLCYSVEKHAGERQKAKDMVESAA